MKLKELKEKITQLETELAQVKEMAEGLKNKTDDDGVFKPEDGQTYWYISDDGVASADWWDDHSIGNDRYSIGNCFPTKQAAEDAVRLLKLIQKARGSQGGFVPDWEDSMQDKYFFYFHNDGIGVGNLVTMNLAPTFGVWRDESVCEQFIKENKNELIWFFTKYKKS